MCIPCNVGKTRRCVIFWDQERLKLYQMVHHAHHHSSRIPFYRLPGVLRNHPQLATQGRLTLLQSLRGATLAPWGHATVEDMQIALRRDDGNNTVGRMIRPSEINSTDLQELGDPYKVIRPKDALPEVRRDASPHGGTFRLETAPMPSTSIARLNSMGAEEFRVTCARAFACIVFVSFAHCA